MKEFHAIAIQYTDTTGQSKIFAYACTADSEETAIGSALKYFNNMYSFSNILGIASDSEEIKTPTTKSQESN